jgi:DNA-directed RNA polymerase subunit RPC12/RpoP
MNFIQIRSFDNYIKANIQLSMLQDEGINCYLKDEYTVTIDPLLNPAIGGIKLMIYELQAERAESILEDADEQYLKSIPCPDCGHHALKKIVQIRKAQNMWQRLSFIFLTGSNEEVKKYYICSSCNSVFDEIPVEE